MKAGDQGATLGEHYIALAVRFRGKAKNEKNRVLKDECERLAECYMELAKETETELSLSV